MKKQILAIALVSFTVSVQAQNLSLYDSQTSQNIPSGTTLYYNHTDPANFIDVHVHVNNLMSSSANIKVRKTHLYNPAGITTQFCTDQLCYPPSVFLTPNASTVGIGAYLDVKAQYKPESNTPATSAVRYAAWDMTNPNDSVYFIIVYNGVTGIQPVQSINLTLGAPSPNPTASVAGFQYEVGGKAASSQLVIFNMLGEKVKELALTEEKGNLRVDVSSMQQGIYFCSLTVDGKAIVTRRLVVTR